MVVEVVICLADEVVLLVLAGVGAVERSALCQQVLQSAGGHAKAGSVVASTHLPLEHRLVRTDLHRDGLWAGGRGLVLLLDQTGDRSNDEEGRHY